jgi:type IV secretory pathway TraG/TraD family ATPase VirD4
MRGNDPDSAEYFSKVIGTIGTTKLTERHSKGLFNYKSTGEASAREVEEFRVHPNSFKRELGVGQAMMLVPHDDGMELVKIKFHKLPDIKSTVPIPDVEKKQAKDLVFTKTEEPNAVPTQAIAQAVVQNKNQETEVSQ